MPNAKPLPFPASANAPECASMRYDPDNPGAWDQAAEEQAAGQAIYAYPLAVHICVELWRGEFESDSDLFEWSRFQAASWCADNPDHAAVIQAWAAPLPLECVTLYAHVAAHYYASGAIGNETQALIYKVAGLPAHTPKYFGPDGLTQPALLAAQALTPAPVREALAAWRDELI